MDETDDDDMLWNVSEEDVHVRKGVRKMKTLTVKRETVIMICKGRKNLTCFGIKCMKLIAKHFFLSRHLYLWGAHFRLEFI
jgi:hypothetical protein